MLRLWENLVRWRTWIVNVIFGVILTPELILVLIGADWGAIVPKGWLPYIAIANAVLNVWMRPRAAVLPTDPEVELSLRRKEGGDGSA